MARIRRSHRRGRGSIPRTGGLEPMKDISIFIVKNVMGNDHLPSQGLFSSLVHIPCGLVARIRRFHRRGRGSIPRKGGSNFRNSKFRYSSNALMQP